VDRRTVGGALTVSGLLVLASIVVFVLVAFGVTVLGASELEETAAGLALFAAAHLVP
jgi:hypothetical protein